MIYRPEHPDPQWERDNWRNLNGEWEFDFDFGDTATDRKLYEAESLPLKINVPFCPESDLSGIGYKDFIDAVCYRRTFTLSGGDLGGRVFLHFEAVDYECRVYVNGRYAASHKGGYASFASDITPFVREGVNTLFVPARDSIRSGEQPSGKQQASQYSPSGCYYHRTTGIWQSVWLEFVPNDYIKSAKYHPDTENGVLYVTGETCGDGVLEASAIYDGRTVANSRVRVENGVFRLRLPLDELHLWEPGKGRLYDLVLEFGKDRVKSYFGMRSVCLKDNRFLVNSKPVFQRFVLDQGFYPDGIYTAKEDSELKKDIELSMAAGFNGARLHQKVFEKRFLYHCDKAGYMVYGEHANWGIDYENPVAAENFICEWTEILARDYNHPSVIGWCPFNETWHYREFASKHRLIESVYRITKQIDPDRICVPVSGNYHIDDMEMHDVHDYSRDYNTFRESFAHISEGKVMDGIYRNEGDIQKYRGKPIFVSEYGGFPWIENGEGWGYGDMPADKEEFYVKYAAYTDVLLDNPYITGFCYTQLYDVEQEKNGLYTYDRKPKFDMERIRGINAKPARIEKK